LLYSRKRSLRLAPTLSARTQSEPVYLPPDAAVVVTQFGESLRVQLVVDAPALVSLAAKAPLWPPLTLVRVTLVLPEVFQPDRPASKPGFLTRLVPPAALETVTLAVAWLACPAVSVTVTVTVKGPLVV
jgi:hypothetical protein